MANDTDLKNELEFCKENMLGKNGHGNYIYTSSDGADAINIPLLLQEYKEWLLVNNLIQ